MEKIRLSIEGMTCAACSARIERALSKEDSVSAVVSLSTEEATIQYNNNQELSHFVSKIQKLGFSVRTSTVELDIQGMTCAACSARIERSLQKMEGITQVAVNVARESGSVTFYTNVIQVEDIIERIEKIGFQATIKERPEEKKERQLQELKEKRNTVLISTVLSLPLLFTMVAHFPFLSWIKLPDLFLNPYFQFVLATPVQFYIGSIFYKGAFFALKNKSANMDVLVALGTSAAYFYSIIETIRFTNHTESHLGGHYYYETSAVLITLILFGKYLEARAKLQTSQAIEKLMALQVKEARVIENNEERMIAIERVSIGSMILVKPSEKIPLDGVIIEGSATIDESMLTGESIPVLKSIGDNVFGATLCSYSPLKIQVTHSSSQSILSQIIATVEAAQGTKAPIQRFADRISSVFVPIVISIALLTWIIWFFFITPYEFSSALEVAISVLVIACPCALGLATPTSIMVGSGIGAQNGILFKGGEYIERLSSVSTIVFDKTGTLTEGKPIVTYSSVTNNDVMQALYTLEKQSEHPLAHAIVQFYEAQNMKTISVENVMVVPGKGIYGTYENKQIIVGTRSLLKHVSLTEREKDEWLAQEQTGHTVIGVAFNDTFYGILSIRDELKKEAVETVKALQELGKEVILLTGDNNTTAHAIGKAAHIQTIQAEVLPTEKSQYIEQLQKEGHTVAMIGDGINDAPALALADVGIAMGSGTDIAIEAAHVTLLGGNISLVTKMIVLSNETMKNIRQNLFWAFAYNTLGIPIAAFGLLSPWVAGAAMALSSVSVVSNALRLKKRVLIK